MCEWPPLMVSTRSSRTSQPMTFMPLLAYCAARGSPILPSPTTATLFTGTDAAYRLDSGSPESARLACRQDQDRRVEQAEHQPEVGLLEPPALELAVDEYRQDHRRGQ